MREARDVSKYERRGIGQDTAVRMKKGWKGKEGRRSYGGEDATEDEAKTVYVSVVVRVVFHGGRWVVGGLGSIL